jgi:hypothetical protein
MMNAISKSVDALHPLVNLVQDADTMHVGFVVKMDYETAVVLTNDRWKQQCGGVPRNAFLVATAFDPADIGKSDPNDRVVVLLRARNDATLPQDGDTLKAIIEHYQRKTEIQAPDRLDGIEKITHARLQFKGLECNILGTFYADSTGQMFMGSDVENFFSVARLRVYKPTLEALEKIVNFIDPLREAKAREDAKILLRGGKYPEPIPIGTVRYTSTNPNQIAQHTNAPVNIQPMDFLARRTAVFGMTRTGKSNTVKTTVASVATVAKEANVKIGQIIFDIKGEYANANGKDDGSSLAEALGADVIRYRNGKPKPGFLDLRDNFYRSLTSGLTTLQFLLEDDPAKDAADMATLINLSLEPPDQARFTDQNRYQSAVKRHAKKIAIYKAIVFRAELEAAPADRRITFEIGKDIYDQMHGRIDPACTTCTNKDQRSAHAKQEFGDPAAGMDIEDVVTLLTEIRHANKTATLRNSQGKPWLDEIEKGLLNLLVGESDGGVRIRATRVIGNKVKQWHSVNGSDNVPRDVYNYLTNGKVVIVDLSVGGTEATRKGKSESIARHILGQALEAMADEKEPPIVMIYAEEAHNLIGKDDDLDDTWPRLAKEGAAMNIGMVYCTQEPSSIHPNIMSNTENFFVTHLNNDKEIKSIGDYYDFTDFKEVIKKAQDVGFSRIKTLSSSFVIPTQILRFTPSEVKKRYEAAGGTGAPTNGSPVAPQPAAAPLVPRKA